MTRPSRDPLYRKSSPVMRSLLENARQMYLAGVMTQGEYYHTRRLAMAEVQRRKKS